MLMTAGSRKNSSPTDKVWPGRPSLAMRARAHENETAIHRTRRFAFRAACCCHPGTLRLSGPSVRRPFNVASPPRRTGLGHSRHRSRPLARTQSGLLLARLALRLYPLAGGKADVAGVSVPVQLRRLRSRSGDWLPHGRTQWQGPAVVSGPFLPRGRRRGEEAKQCRLLLPGQTFKRVPLSLTRLRRLIHAQNRQRRRWR